MASKRSPYPVMFAPARIRVPEIPSIEAKRAHSLPILPNGMEAVRDLETGQIRVKCPAKRRGNRD